MPTTRRSRVLPVSPERVWDVLGDPYHLARWWPRVHRVEDVTGDRFTTVMPTSKGKLVRADYRVLEATPGRRLRWEQELAGSPFERLLAQAITAIELDESGEGTRVSIEVRQRLRGWSRFGGSFFRRAARKQLEEALSDLEGIVVR